MSAGEQVPGALAGWRVLELADRLAAAFCAKVLGDLGADVVKVEPPEGHASRRWAPRRADAAPDEPGGRFLYLNTGKASVIVGDGPSGREDLDGSRPTATSSSPIAPTTSRWATPTRRRSW